MPVPRPPFQVRNSPNRSRRHERVRFIVMHDTVGSFPGDIGWLTNPASEVSSDFYVQRNGEVWQLNPDLRQAKTWHAGTSLYQQFSNLNEYSIGIEMEHRFDTDDWPEQQVQAAARLAAWLVEEFDLDLVTQPIVSHAQVALPPGRKRDPRNLPWSAFGQQVRQSLGERAEPAKLVWGATGQAIPVELRFVAGTTLATAEALTAATGFSRLVPMSEDGLVAVRPFFEAHGFRVEWDAASRQIAILPQPNEDCATPET